MKYRGRTDIISTILQSAMHGATKTRLMYSAFLSYAQIQEYIQFLTERQLISFSAENGEYKLTEKGLHFLRVYEEISEIIALDGAKASDKGKGAPNLLE
jgi:predicted transcriptional regulator